MTANQDTKPLTEQTPVEIDTVLAELEAVTAEAWLKLFTCHDRLIKATDRLAEIDPDGYEGKYQVSKAIERCNSEMPALQLAHDAALEAERPYTEEFTRRGGWTRAYLVDNTNGHVHKWRRCVTCHPTTRYFWLTQFSGADETQIVEAAGETACTECYPSAPVDTLKRRSTIEAPSRREARLIREAKAAAKAAKDEATGIANPDGSPLRGHWGVIKTERSAQIELVDIIASHRAWGYSDHADVQEVLFTALAHKRGQTVEQVRADIESKVIAKIKRDSK